MIGVARFQRAQRHAVETGEDQIRHEIQLGNTIADRLRQRGDMIGIVEIGRHGAQRWLPAHVHQRAGGIIHHRGIGGRRILRIHRRQQDAITAGLHQRREPFSDAARAVTHGPIHLHGRPQPHLQRGGLALGIHRDGGAFVHPHLGIIGRGGARADVQYQQVEDRPPQDLRNLDHTAVRQELAQEALHRRHIRCIGRTEIDQQHADPPGFHRLVIGRQRDRRQDERAGHAAKKGRLRQRLAVAANSALATAGAIGGVPGSPMPPGSASDAMMRVSISGQSAMATSG